ncbi:MAG: hypothetical protein AB7P04_12165, partial [Bacteriovoracia bacterium]
MKRTSVLAVLGIFLFGLSVSTQFGCGKLYTHVESMDQSTKRMAEELERDREYIRAMVDEMRSLAQSLREISGIARSLRDSLAPDLIEIKDDGQEIPVSLDNLPEDSMRDLKAGKSLKFRSPVEGKPRSTITILQKAKVTPLQAIAVWSDFDSAVGVVPGIRSAKPTRASGAKPKISVDYVAEILAFGRAKYRIDYRPFGAPNYRLEFEMTESDRFKENAGTIWFRPFDGGTVIISSSYFDPGSGIIPDAVLAGYEAKAV